MRIYAGIVTAAILTMFGWVWNTNAQVRDNVKDLETHSAAVAVIPQMQIDIAVIKHSQLVTDGNIQEIKVALKELARR